MILFKERFKDDILSGRKTVTRRGGKKRWNAGATHQCRCSFFAPYFAKVKILSVTWVPMSQIFDEEEAEKEGFETATDFLREYMKINHLDHLPEPRKMVWRVEFEVAA